MMQNSKNLQPLDILACNSPHRKMSLHFIHLGKKAFLSNFKKTVYVLNYRLKLPEVADFLYFGIITIMYP